MKIDPLCDAAIAHLGIHPKEMIYSNEKVTCNPIFAVIQSTIEKTQKEPRCPFKNKWTIKL